MLLNGLDSEQGRSSQVKEHHQQETGREDSRPVCVKREGMIYLRKSGECYMAKAYQTYLG